MSVSNFKNMGFRNIFKGFDSFGFLKFRTYKPNKGNAVRLMGDP